MTQTIALITGANQGIGLQVARDLAASGVTVLMGSRDMVRGKAAAREVGPAAVAIQLDVTDAGSIAAAAERVRLEYGRLDVLIQNAAIATVNSRPQSGEALAAAGRPSVIPLQDMRTIWDTNVFGVVAVYQAMLPLLRATPGARVINVSSAVGSLTINSDPASRFRAVFDAGYAVSKTALNGLTLAMAIELEAEGIRVNAVSPGHTPTRMTGFSGTDTVEEGAAEIVRLALLRGDEGATGAFTHATHGVVPW